MLKTSHSFSVFIYFKNLDKKNVVFALIKQKTSIHEK